MFGESTARKYKKYIQKGYNAYIGYTSSDYGTITSFFTTDSFEIDEHDFYVNARNCLW